MMGRIYRALRLSHGNKTCDVVAFVDSGSDRTVISERMAKRLGLRTRGGEKIKVANREVIDTRLAKLRILSILDNIDCVIRVAVTDMPFELEPDENIDMIIGLDFLQKNRIKLIFEK